MELTQPCLFAGARVRLEACCVGTCVATMCVNDIMSQGTDVVLCGRCVQDDDHSYIVVRESDILAALS